jgi:hypothetical protein
MLQLFDIAGIVDNHHRIGRSSDDLNESRDLRLADHFSRNEQTADTRADHHLRFRYRCDANADRASFYLAASDKGAFVRFGMRA